MFLLRNIPPREKLEELAALFPQMDPSAVETMLNLLRVATDIIETGEKRWSRVGLSPGRLAVLMTLLRSPEKSLTPAQIAARIGVTRATITGLVDKLVRNGIVERIPNEDDRRKVDISLTKQGKNLMMKYMPTHFSGVAALMRHMSEEDRTKMLELLGKIRKGLDGLRDGAEKK